MVIIFVMAAMFSACNAITSAISNLVHDDDVVARIGDEILYKSQLASYIPVGISGEDSTKLVKQYINSWATEVLFTQKAKEQLTASELDVTPELEAYRRSLLKFRYEQRYINERLDTLITDDQVKAYYEAHQSDFILERPILKVRFVDILKESPDKSKIIKLMASESQKDVDRASELAFGSALKYFDSSETWMDALILAREFGTDYGTMLSKLSGSYITIESEGEQRTAFVCDIRRSGVAPLEFCKNRICEYILSGRKHDLMGTLEQELLEDAISHNKLEIL